MIRQIWNRLQLMYAVGTGNVIGADKIQASILDGETLNNIDRVEPYGFSYRPKKGCRAYILFPAGDRARGFALVIGDKRYQMDLSDGEVAVHDDEGNHMHLKRGGTIEVKAATKVIADTPLFETTHDAKIGGNLLVVGTTHLTQQATCDAVVIAAGFSGAAGAPASLPGGLNVAGQVQANGKNIGETHTHTAQGANAVTTGVN